MKQFARGKRLMNVVAGNLPLFSFFSSHMERGTSQ
jgi:hypothetical protein